MTTVGMPRELHRRPAPSARARGTLQMALLACGVVSSLWYAATDLLGGLRYPGYSFTAQTISELGAIGAPTRDLVAPMFSAYPALALAFALGVLREGARGRRALRVAGALLVGYAAAGFASAFFPMRAPRGQGSLAADLPHLIVMSAIVLLLLLAIGAGAFALGRRFRRWSVATIAAMLLAHALTSTFIRQVASGGASPGLGIVERVEVYAPMLWLGVLSVALLRGAASRGARAPATGGAP